VFLRISLLPGFYLCIVELMDKIKLQPNSYRQLIAFSSIITIAFAIVLFSSLLMTSAPHTASATLSSVNATGAQPQKIVQQGVVTSSTDPLPGHEAHQSAVILRLRNDNSLYDGTLTFTASKPVEVQILHRSVNSTTPTIPAEFGTLNVLPLPGNAGTVTISNIIPEYPEGSFVATVPFSGNAISLHNIEGEPFVASYSVAANIDGPAQRADDISAAETPTEVQTIEEEEEPTDEEEDSQNDENGDEGNGDEGNGDEEQANQEQANQEQANQEPTPEP
jgi:hypothetical protein